MVKGHCFHIHHLIEPRILHHLGVHAVAVLAGLKYNPREYYRLAALLLDRAREWHAKLHLEIIARAFPVLERAVIPPNLARLLRHPAVGFQVLLWHRKNISIDVLHTNLLNYLTQR